MSGIDRPLRYEEIGEQYRRDHADRGWQPLFLGFGTLDAELKGLTAGRVLGIAARSAVGKTSLLQTVEENLAHRRDAGQLLLTLEVTAEDWFERSLAIRLGVEAEEVERAAQQEGFHTYAESLYESRVNTRIYPTCTLEGLPGAIQRTKADLKVPLRVVLIDYLGLLQVQGRDAYERASKIGLALKSIAKNEEVAIVVAMQISRAGGDGSLPVSMDMLRDSGVLEESLDFLLGCWRPSFNQELTPEEQEGLADVMYVKILKNRRGKQGRQVLLRFHAESRKVFEIADPFQEF